MSTTKTFAGNSYNLPLNREPKSSDWGTHLSNFVIAVADNALSKTGGSFTLSAEMNFGATYGILLPYIKSASSNVAAAGVVRLANLDKVSWRNAANGADLSIKVNASDKLEYDGTIAAAFEGNLTGNVTGNLTGNVTGNVTGDVTGNVSGSSGSTTGNAATVTTNANLTGPVTSVGNATAIADGAIALAKLATTTAGYFPVGAVTTGIPTYVAMSGDATLASTGALTLGTVAIAKGGTGQTSANNALNALLPSQAAQTNKVLTTDGTDTSWTAVATTVTTTRGDLIRRGASADERFAAVTDNRVVRGDGTDVISGQIDDPDFFAAGAYATDAAAGTLPPATSMSDGLATALGFKQYLGDGTTYNAGVAPTISGTDYSATIRATYTPYKTQAGGWRLRFNLGVTIGARTDNFISLSIAGVTFKNVANYYQAISAYTSLNTSPPQGRAVPNTDDVLAVFYGAAFAMAGDYFLSGDVELESKPTWAY